MYVKAVREGGGAEERVGMLSILPELPELNPWESGVEDRQRGDEHRDPMWFRRIYRAEKPGLVLVEHRRVSSNIGPARLFSTPASPSLCALSCPRDRGQGWSSWN